MVGERSLLVLVLLALLAGCEKPPPPAPWVVIGTFDYRQVSATQILSVLKEAGIEGAPGSGGRVHQLLVRENQAKEAVAVLQKSKLPGIRLHEIGSGAK